MASDGAAPGGRQDAALTGRLEAHLHNRPFVEDPLFALNQLTGLEGEFCRRDAGSTLRPRNNFRFTLVD